MYPAHMGAITPMYAATSPELQRADSGSYFIPWARHGTPSQGTQDVDLAMKLWDFLRDDVDMHAIERERLGNGRGHKFEAEE